MKPFEEEIAAEVYAGAQENPRFSTAVKLIEETIRGIDLEVVDSLTRVKMLIHLARLAQHTGLEPNNLHQLAGKSLLDIACGREDRDISMRPWLCDMADRLGCRVTGVDHPSATIRAPWTFMGIDLSDARGLYTFPVKSFDIVHCTHLILNDRPVDNDPEFRAQFSTKDAYDIAANSILYQMQQIVKPDGTLILNDTSFKDGRWKR